MGPAVHSAQELAGDLAALVPGTLGIGDRAGGFGAWRPGVGALASEPLRRSPASKPRSKPRIGPKYEWPSY
jgi:hypothetical protein